MAVFTKSPLSTGSNSHASHAFDMETSSKSAHFELTVDVYNFPEKICLVAPVAGVDRDSIALSLKDDVLYIRGHIENPYGDSGEYAHTEECTWGAFERPIILPKEVALKDISAKVTKEYILIVTVPKLEKDMEKVIRVEIE